MTRTVEATIARIRTALLGPHTAAPQDGGPDRD